MISSNFVHLWWIKKVGIKLKWFSRLKYAKPSRVSPLVPSNVFICVTANTQINFLDQPLYQLLSFPLLRVKVKGTFSRLVLYSKIQCLYICLWICYLNKKTFAKFWPIGGKNAIFQDCLYFYSIRGDKCWHFEVTQKQYGWYEPRANLSSAWTAYEVTWVKQFYLGKEEGEGRR